MKGFFVSYFFSESGGQSGFDHTILECDTEDKIAVELQKQIDREQKDKSRMFTVLGVSPLSKGT